MIIIGIMLLLALPAHAVDIDDRDPGMTFSSTPGWHELRLSSANQGDTLRSFNHGAWATFRPTLTGGTYDVYMRWPIWSGTLPDHAAVVIVRHSAGQQSVMANQQRDGGKWTLLGRWALDSGSFVSIANRGAGPVYADAVRFVSLAEPCAPTVTTTSTTSTTTTTLKPVAGLGPIVGLNVQQHAGTFDSAGQAFTKDLGIHSIRVAYNHGDYDAGVNWAAQNGIGVLFSFGYGGNCNATTAAGRQCYADRSANLVRRYGNKVHYWEVWNEWNGGIGLGRWPTCLPSCQDAAMYTDLLCRTYRAVKAAKPDAVMVGGATAGADIPFLTRMMAAGAGRCMDMISVHPYPFSQHSKISAPIGSSATVLANTFIEAVKATGRLASGMPILVSEEGLLDSLDEQRSADYLAQIYRRSGEMPQLRGIWWFSIEDVGTGRYGVLRSNNTKKPAFFALKAAASRPSSLYLPPPIRPVPKKPKPSLAQ